jgi:hypothetical protein
VCVLYVYIKSANRHTRSIRLNQLWAAVVSASYRNGLEAGTVCGRFGNVRETTKHAKFMERNAGASSLNHCCWGKARTITILKWNKMLTPSGTNIFLFYYFQCWQLVSAWIGHHQANIYKKLKNYGAYTSNIIRQYHGIPFPLIIVL